MRNAKSALVAAVLLQPVCAGAADGAPGSQVNIGAVLDGRYQEGVRALSEVEEGLSLGHTEIALDANIDSRFRGAVTTVLESHDGDIEVGLEEAYVETLGLPGGLNIRAGRMFSQFGYLNSRHLHEDDFSDRPVAYRSYLGDHYFDDGVAVSTVLPTERYVRLGFEAFSGDKLAAESVEEGELDTVNVFTGQLKTGGDLGVSNSWQLGLSYLRNRHGAALASLAESGHEDEHGHEEEHGEEHSEAEHAHEESEHGHETGHAHHESGHSHSASVTGEHLYGVDLTWKWAPNGNYRDRNLAITAEYLVLDELMNGHGEHAADAPGSVDGWYLSLAYQFSPQWTAGLRYGEAETWSADGAHDWDGHGGEALGKERIKEIDASLAWHPSHFSTVRANYTRQRQSGHGGSEDENIFVVQYVMSLGAHGAHRY